MEIFIKKIKRYFRAKFRSDLNAGLTVAMVVIPQAMAYAAIAGVNPIYGLFTAIIPTIVAALSSKFPYLIIGPTNPTALVTASVLVSFLNRPDYIEFVFALAIIAGLFNIIFGFLKLGKISRYISNSVLVGFLTGVGLLVISLQLGNLLGIQLAKEGGLLGIFRQLLENFSNINIYTLLIGLLGFGTMILTRKINRKLPASLITIVISTIFVAIVGWDDTHNINLVKDYGLPSRLGMGFHIPQISLGEFSSLIISGAAVAIFGFMETISIAKSMSQMTGEPLNPSHEMASHGLACFVGGFFQCMPSSGSPSRTVMNVVNGAKTKFSAVFSGLSVLLFLLIFSRMIGEIPMATLTAVVMLSASGLINIPLIKVTWQSRIISRWVMLITFFATLFVPLQYAIYLGILFSILVFLVESSRINLSYIIEDDDGQFVELSLEKITQRKSEIAIVNIEGDLYFAAVEDLQQQIEEVLTTDLKVLILRFRRTHLLASTAIMALNSLIRTAHKKGIAIFFCGVNEDIWESLKDSGVLDTIGMSKTFRAKDQIFKSTHVALEEAKALLKSQEAKAD
jgi:SulP family sulfate permease